MRLKQHPKHPNGAPKQLEAQQPQLVEKPKDAGLSEAEKNRMREEDEFKHQLKTERAKQENKSFCQCYLLMCGAALVFVLILFKWIGLV